MENLPVENGAAICLVVPAKANTRLEVSGFVPRIGKRSDDGENKEISLRIPLPRGFASHAYMGRHGRQRVTLILVATAGIKAQVERVRGADVGSVMPQSLLGSCI